MQILPPSTPLPSGWSIEPMSGHCIRISDGAQFGQETSRAIAWSMRDIRERDPSASGLAVDLARLRNAIGCASIDQAFTGNAKGDAAAANAAHAAGDRLAGLAGNAWHWRPEHAPASDFNQRLGCFLDAIGIARAHHPAADLRGAEVWLLTGCIGRIAVRSELTTQDGRTVGATLEAQACEDASGALRCARGWAIAAARQCLADSAEAALALIYRIPYHDDDVGCLEVIRSARSILAGKPAASTAGAAAHERAA